MEWRDAAEAGPCDAFLSVLRVDVAPRRPFALMGLSRAGVVRVTNAAHFLFRYFLFFFLLFCFREKQK